MTAQLETMIAEYVALATELKRKVPALGAILGNNSNVTHPGHMAFYEAVSAWVADFAATSPDRESLGRALELLLLAAKEQERTAACWYLIAIQAHAKPLLPLLEAQDRQDLLRRYEAAYPTGKRLPVQQEIHQLLGGQRRRFPFWKSH